MSALLQTALSVIQNSERLSIYFRKDLKQAQSCCLAEAKDNQISNSLCYGLSGFTTVLGVDRLCVCTRVQDEADQMSWPVNKDSCSLAPSGEWDNTQTGGEAHTRHHSPSQSKTSRSIAFQDRALP